MALDVLALRAAGLGDLLTSVPALRAVAELSADGVTVAAPRWLHPIVALVPGVRDAVDVRGLSPAVSLSGKVVINLHGRGPQSHRALLEGHPRDLVAFRCPQVWEFGPQWFTDDDPDEPERERFCRLLGWVGVDADPDNLGLRVPPTEPLLRDAIVLHVGGTDTRRRWPPAAFAELARRLHGQPVVITGGAGDLVTAHRAAQAAGLEPDAVFAGRITLSEFAGVVSAARVVVTGDTGAAHLAHAYDARSVVVFGPASPRQWGPPPTAPSILLRAPGTAPMAGDVSVDEVEAAVINHLEAA
jgi:ADP-heptose:LPS heptosyltransferase